MNSKSSFAKKEVVVALGCVVFVLANLGAVGSTGRRRAKEAVCLSNLKQWGVIWKSYVDDHNGYFAERGRSFDPDEHTMRCWPYITSSYYKNSKMLFCPEATKSFIEGGRPPFAAWNTDRDGGPPICSSYCINIWVARFDDEGRDPEKFWRTPYVAEPAYVPLHLDGNWMDAEPEPYDEAPPYDGYWWEPNANEMKRVCVNRHRGAVNGVFVDFSARRIGLKELWKLNWHRKWPSDAVPASGWPEWMENLKNY